MSILGDAWRAIRKVPADRVLRALADAWQFIKGGRKPPKPKETKP
jgi:hypothetical protein